MGNVVRHSLASGGMEHQKVSQHTSGAVPPQQTPTHSLVLFIHQAFPQPHADLS